MAKTDFGKRLEETAATLRKVGEGLQRAIEAPLPVYSHRNGEWGLLPTEPGYYWYKGLYTEGNAGIGNLDGEMLRVSFAYPMGYVNHGPNGWYLGQFTGRFWGPVTPPWESAQIPQDKVKWSKKFRRDLAQWPPCLPGRLLSAIRRTAACFEMLERSTLDSDLLEGPWRYISQEAMLVFGNDGTLLDFNEWILILREEPDRLLYVRDVGKKGARQLLDAIDNYLLSSVEHAA